MVSNSVVFRVLMLQNCKTIFSPQDFLYFRIYKAESVIWALKFKYLNLRRNTEFGYVDPVYSVHFRSFIDYACRIA